MTSHTGYTGISDSFLQIHSANSFTFKYAAGNASLSVLRVLVKVDVYR